MQQTKRCGSCHFAKLIDRDITKRMCHGAPPTAIQVPAPIPGQMTFQMARPIVSVIDEACALYRGKDATDVINDAQAAQQLQSGVRQ